MTRGSARLAVQVLGTLGVAFLLAFLLLHAMPGDPADRLDSPSIPAEQADRTRRALGLDQPLPLQLLHTLGGYARGDLGVSFAHRRPAGDVLLAALPATAALGGAALLLAYGIGLPLSLLLVGAPARFRDAANRLLLALATVPRFWLAVMLIFLLHSLAGWFPASHTAPPGGGDWLDHLRHLVLPALTLGLPAAAVVCRYQLAAMKATLADPHVRAARAAGGAGPRMLIQHVLRPSASVAVTLFGLDIPILVSGAVVVELVFAWPGLGRLAAEAILGFDYPLALAAVLLSAATVIVGRLAAEFIADRLDPRRVARPEGRGA